MLKDKNIEDTQPILGTSEIDRHVIPKGTINEEAQIGCVNVTDTVPSVP